MNIESTILKTLLSLIESHLSKGDTDFDFDELEDETVSDSVFSNTPHPVLRLALKPLLTQELRELLQKIFSSHWKNSSGVKYTKIFLNNKGV